VSLEKRRDLVFWSLLLLIMAAFVAWQWQPAHQFAWRYDEGVDVMKARLLLEGYALYGEIYADMPPLLTLLLAASFALLGQSVFVGRILVLGLSVLCLPATGYIGRHLTGRLMALVMVLFLTLLPQFQQLSRLIFVGMPAISVGLMALAAGLRHQTTGKMIWLALAGLLFSFSLLIKPITAPLYLPLSALVLLGSAERSATQRERIYRWVAISAVIAGPLLVTLAVFGPHPLISQVAGTVVQARQAHGFAMGKNLVQIGHYLFRDKWGGCHAGLVCLAGVGFLSLAIRRRWSHLVPLGLWLGGVFAAVVFHWPLRDHELFLLMPALVVPAGIGIERTATGLKAFGQSDTTKRVLVAMALVCVILAAASVPSMVRKDSMLRAHCLEPDTNQEELIARDTLRFLESRIPPDGVIITDDTMLAFKSGLLVPPALAATPSSSSGSDG